MGRKKNLVGKVFCRLTVLEFDRICKSKTYWKCRCSCGNILSARSDQIQSGNTRSCGCLSTDEKSEYENLMGRKFNRLLVKREGPRGNQGQIRWICKCDCGESVVVSSISLKTGHSKSCGCFHREKSTIQAFVMGKANITHGKAYTREYQVWHGMHQRCSESGDKNYYGRGIRVCKRWGSFERFFEDMGMRPSPKHQIDRIDVNGNYTPENCHWVLPKEQQRNKRCNVMIAYEGKTKPISSWAEEKGMTTLQLWARIRKMGWPIHEAMTLPIAKNIKDKLKYKHLRTIA